MNIKGFTVVTTALGLTLLSGVAVFAQTNSADTQSTNAQAITTKISCVGNAVAAREQAIGAAMTTFTQASTAAYAARATALANAYSQTTPSAVRAAVKTAWSTFTSTERTARKAWQTSRASAWGTFRKAAAACKALAGVNDTSHSELEVSGT